MMRWMYTAVFTVLLATGALGQAASGTTATNANADDVLLPSATFDVATIKPSGPDTFSSSGGTGANGIWTSTNQPLRSAILNAFKVQRLQCTGGPAWLDSDRYDIVAKPDSATTEQLMKLTWKQREPVQQRMHQALLADRLKLKVHFETRQMPIFALVIAKGGLKMHEAKPDNTYANGLKMGDKPLGRSGMMMGNGSWTAQGIPIDSLVANLTNLTGHFVENRTGLTGKYDFAMQYSCVDPPPQDSTLPSIYTALEEQLGLKLESTRGPVQVLVIDHVERPSAN